MRKIVTLIVLVYVILVILFGNPITYATVLFYFKVDPTSVIYYLVTALAIQFAVIILDWQKDNYDKKMDEKYHRVTLTADRRNREFVDFCLICLCSCSFVLNISWVYWLCFTLLVSVWIFYPRYPWQ